MRCVISNKNQCVCVPSSRREDDAREPGRVLQRLKEDSETDGLDD